MKISIYNFKSIGQLANYELRPLTILSGTNSSGKSSFIQFLLLLKQSIETINKDNSLNIDGKLFNVRNYMDLIKDNEIENKLKVEFLYDKSELTNYNDFPELSIYNAFDAYTLSIEIEFDMLHKIIIVSSFAIKIVTELKTDFIKFEHILSKFSIKTNVAVFSRPMYGDDYFIKKINFNSLFPADYEVVYHDGSISKEVPKIEGIKTLLKDFFSSLNYVGPLRQAPKDEYSSSGKFNSVGIDGRNVAEVFCEQSDRIITYFEIEEDDDSVFFKRKQDKFLNAIKYWLCERFKLCSDIYSKKQSDSYVIYVKSLSGIESTIKHVGFGISQVLPVIVEGLLIESNEVLILEQPEIHLHPKIQSHLTDFLISLIEQGKRVIIETHSDHLITRLRRRIVEDRSNQLDDKVQLTFVEVGNNDVLFKNIQIDDFGVLELPYPDDFIEKSDVELKAILKAQMKKRFNQLEK